MPDHTLYNFPHGNGDLRHVFSPSNDSKISTLIKRVGRCQRKTAMPKGGS